jgi:predicted phosphodiesterase
MNKDGNFKGHIKEATPEENEIMFEGVEADVYLYGHTHRAICNLNNGKIFINPGALGCPENTNCAPYGILSITNGIVKYKQLYAEYNVEEVIDDIQKAKFPGYKSVLKLFYGENMS